MSLKTKVKVSNITNLSDARYCAGMGADLLGFPVNSEDREPGLKHLKEISSWISGPGFVLEWSGSPIPADVVHSLPEYNVTFLEVPISMLSSLPLLDVPVIISLDFQQWNSISSYSPMLKKWGGSRVIPGTIEVAYFILTSGDASLPPSSLLHEMGGIGDVLLAIGGFGQTLDTLLALPINGLALAGSHEDKPGLKDYTSLAEIFEKLEMD